MKAFKKIIISVLLVLFFSTNAYAVLPNGDYTLSVYKFNSDGTTTLMETTALTAAGGTATFTLSSIPTHPGTNFLYMTLTDGNGNIVRRGVAPAPKASSTQDLGITELSSAQGRAMKKAGEIVGTDDPILVAFLMVLLRVSENEIVGFEDNIARLGRDCILDGAGGQDSFIQYLLSKGVTSTQLEDFRSELVHSTVDGGKDLGDYAELVKQSVDQGNDNAQYEAGGLMGEIFMSAGEGAGIDAALILAAHDQSGVIADGHADWNALGANLKSSINLSMTSFFMRISAAKNNQTYRSALNVLNASGSQADKFETAIATFLEAQAQIERNYGSYFEDPQAYLTANNTTENAVQTALDNEFDTAFTEFTSDLAATNADITEMRQNVADALGIDVSNLPNDFGTMRDFTGNTVNWPVTNVIVVNWVSSIIANGGGLTYDRNTVAAAIPVPGNMSWLNGNGTRHDFNTGTALDILRGIQEDIQIAEFTLWNIYDDQNQDPTMAQERAAKEDFVDNIATIKNNIGGTTDGSTAVSDAQKKAILTLMQQPSIFD